MTLGLQRADVQRLINPAIRPRSLALPTRNTFASVLAKVQGRPTTASLARPATTSLARPVTASLARPATRSAAPFSTGLAAYQDMVVAAAHKYGIQPELLAAVAQTESGFNPHAQSGAGAKGLMQLMDATARGLGITDSFDPAQSLDGGARFLSGLLKQFNGDVRLALAAYNAGPAAVKKYGGIPPYQETQRYVPKVLGQTDAFRRIFANLPAPESS